MPLPPIFVDLDSVVFIQEDGPCSGYAAMPCHAIDSTGIGRTDATRVYCKDPGRRGERVIARTVPGRKEPGTLTINAWSQEQSDLLHRIWQKNCMFGAQTHLDVCGLPTDITAYTKILDYYGIMPGTLDYSNMDALEGGEGTGLQLALSCTYDDLIEVLKVALAAVPATEITVTEPMTCIYGDLTERCASECGVDRDRCEIIISCTAAVGAAVAQCWYSTDSGVNWAPTGNAPFTPDAATVDIGACCIVEDRWIAFLGALFAGLAGRAAITDDRGVTAWAAVDMGGGVGADYVTSCYVHNAGSIWACGGEATPNGHVWHSTDRGETWTMSEDIVAQILNDIATADGDTIYTVGNANTVMKSTDAGETWTAMTGPAASAVALLAVRALTNDHVLIGGEIDTSNEQLWCSLDGGETWTAMTFTGSTTASTRVASLDLAPQAPRQHVWMVHGVSTAANNYAFRSLDGGYTWERWAAVTNYRYNEIFACDSNNAWIAGDDDGVGGAGQVHYAAPVS
jgi:photosystem II stability/assembly factor-like uncharacterized protein